MTGASSMRRISSLAIRMWRWISPASSLPITPWAAFNSMSFRAPS